MFPRFADPLRVDDAADCYFYHRMSIPGVGEVGGDWDLRSCIDDYLGRHDFEGRRVLDVGAASGFLTFAMEQRGADVVSFDMGEGEQWDVVPNAVVRRDREAVLRERRRTHALLKNAYWFTHARLQSSARVFYGSIYDIPEALGPFDVAVMGMIVGHLRDPFRAIANVAKLCSSHLIITNQAVRSEEPVAFFMPGLENDPFAWWALSDTCLARMLETVGFDIESTATSNPVCQVPGRQRPEECMTLVARRVR
jgi:hypothetical protein